MNILLSRRRNRKDNTDRSNRFKNANKENAFNLTNTSAPYYTDGLHSNDVDISQGKINLQFRVIVTS